MATFIDDRLYREQIRTFRLRLRAWERKAKKYAKARYLGTQLELMKKLPPQLEAKLNEAVALRAQEMEYEKKLENPTQEMYAVLQSVYGGMLFMNVSESIVFRVFPKGRPDPLNVPAGEVELVLKRCLGVLQEDLKEHILAKEKGAIIQKLVDERDTLVNKESDTETAALKARSELVALSAQLDDEENILRHLARADNVLLPGLYRDLFPVGASVEEEPTEDGQPTDQSTGAANPSTAGTGTAPPSTSAQPPSQGSANIPTSLSPPTNPTTPAVATLPLPAGTVAAAPTLAENPTVNLSVSGAITAETKATQSKKKTTKKR